MKVKVIQKAWYNDRIYDPDLTDKDIIIDYAGEKAPLWAEVVAETTKVTEEVEEEEPKENLTLIERNKNKTKGKK